MQRAGLAKELDASALTELASGFLGQLVRPGDPAYDEHRAVWNGSVDRFPSLIARCIGAADCTSCATTGDTAPIRAIICASFFNFTRIS